MTLPIVIYLETNWLVACVLPHHRNRPSARKILEDVESKLCELRIPEVVFLEAPHVIEREVLAHTRAVTATADHLRSVGRNLSRTDLRALANKLIEAEASYRILNFRKELDELIERCQPFRISDLVGERKVLDDIRRSALRGVDIVDAHILSAIANDRARNPDRAAAFLSTNSKEFSVAKEHSKLPRDFYSSRKLVYIETFNVGRARRAWREEAESGWKPASAPKRDPRRREMERLLSSLSDEQLDDALKALQSVPAST